jgi:hypothetical protein
LVWSDPRTPGGEELADLAPGVHDRQGRPARRRVADPASTPINRDSQFPRSRAFLDSTHIFDGHKEPYADEAHFARRT